MIEALFFRSPQMSPRFYRFIVVAGLTVFLVCGSSYAQVRRVTGLSEGRRAGRALDSSMQAGSSGINGSINSRMSGGLLRESMQKGINSSNLYVTGRVSGLANFQGTVPYRGASSFGIDLPSGTLADFNRRSVGVSEALQGGTFSPEPYFSPYNTALGVRGILGGENLPGTNEPSQPNMVRSMTSNLYDEATSNYRSLDSDRIGGRIGGGLDVASLPGSQLGLGESARAVYYSGVGESTPGGYATDSDADLVPSWIVSRTRPGAMFGQLSPYRRTDLARELYAFDRVLPGGDRRNSSRIEGDSDLGYKVGKEYTLPPDMLPDAAEDANASEDANFLGRTPAEEARLPRRNEDVYLDLVMQMRRIQQQRQLAEKSREVPGGPGSDAAEGAAGVLAPQRSVAGIVDYDAENRQVIVRRLAGLGESDINLQLQRGREQLNDGEYYSAVGSYQTAAILAPENPLPHVGMTLGYFAAGEAYSAGTELLKAVKLFPPMMEIRVDVASMMDPEVIREQLRRYEITFQKDKFFQPSPEVPFVMSFLHWSLGNAAQAVRYATLLKRLEPEDPVLQAYVEFQLTGSRPDSPAVAPSSPGPDAARTAEPPAENPSVSPF
jgi:tetratricopeptide (TPR) repeat protein